MSERKALGGRLSDEARRGWDLAVRESGGTITSLLEAMGLAFDQRSFRVPQDIVDKAREVAPERRKRA